MLLVSRTRNAVDNAQDSPRTRSIRGPKRPWPEGENPALGLSGCGGQVTRRRVPGEGC